MQLARLIGAVVTLALPIGLSLACSGPEQPPYGAPNSLEGKEPPKPPVTGGAGGGCTPDKYVGGTSTVSFKNVIMPLMQTGKAGCSETKSCHGGGVPPKITADPTETYTSLIAWKTQGVPYVNPCSKDKAQAKFAPNLRGDAQSGSKMPFPPGIAFTAAEVTQVEQWQSDGAPLN